MDDLIITSDDKNDVDFVKNQLCTEFEMKDLSIDKIVFLGLGIEKVTN